MDENQSYANYLARLFGLIIALFLFGMAIWLTVRLIQRGNDEEVTVVDEATPTDVISDTSDQTSGELDILKGESDERDLVIVSDEANDQITEVVATAAGATLTSTPLPNTGPEANILNMICIALFGGMFWRWQRSRAERRSF